MLDLSYGKLTYEGCRKLTTDRLKTEIEKSGSNALVTAWSIH